MQELACSRTFLRGYICSLRSKRKRRGEGRRKELREFKTHNAPKEALLAYSRRELIIGGNFTIQNGLSLSRYFCCTNQVKLRHGRIFRGAF